MTHYIAPVAARQVAASIGLHITTAPELAALVRLAVAAAQVRAQADAGVLFEGYDGAEPQRTQAAAALDELEDATDAAIAALQAIAARSTARQVHHL
ncbi:hypothetical protein [Thauera phenylacetica]|uniref:hypothetical protein n=1 Tax=Thauera phenylacetica TaxID=164400 RepID=UPI0039E49F28